jgi:hypothetical protein
LIVSIPSFRQSHPNAKSPDVPGGFDIASDIANVSPSYSVNYQLYRHCRACLPGEALAKTGPGILQPQAEKRRGCPAQGRA